MPHPLILNNEQAFRPVAPPLRFRQLAWVILLSWGASNFAVAQTSNGGPLNWPAPSNGQQSGGGSGSSGGQGAGDHFGRVPSDRDRDGLSDTLELLLGTDLDNRDTDGDQVWDSAEFMHMAGSPLPLRGGEWPDLSQSEVCLAASMEQDELIITAMLASPNQIREPRFVVYGLFDDNLVNLTSLFLAELAVGNFTYVRDASGVALLAIDLTLPEELVGVSESVAFGMAANLGDAPKARGIRVFRSAAGVLQSSWRGTSNLVRLSHPLEADSGVQSNDWTEDLTCQRLYRVVKEGDGHSSVVTYECDYSWCQVFEGSSCSPTECAASQGMRITMISLSFLISLVS